MNCLTLEGDILGECLKRQKPVNNDEIFIVRKQTFNFTRLMECAPKLNCALTGLNAMRAGKSLLGCKVYYALQRVKPVIVKLGNYVAMLTVSYVKSLVNRSNLRVMDLSKSLEIVF